MRHKAILSVLATAAATAIVVSSWQTPTATEAVLLPVPTRTTTSVETIRLMPCEDVLDLGSCVMYDEGQWHVMTGAVSYPVRVCEDDASSGCLKPVANRDGTFNLYVELPK